jgi:hypothetical protein
LIATAVSIGVIHTLLGPDHYLPFIAIAKARMWSMGVAAIVTILCGIAHVGSSVVIGLAGIALGISISKLEHLESTRGDIAAWVLFGFGLLYMAWGLWRARKSPDTAHHHLLGKHAHHHRGDDDEGHYHDNDASASGKKESMASWKELTPWVLFTIFVFGPCEPLIPILMYPAAKLSMAGVLLVSGAFALATISTMLVLVLGALAGLRPVSFRKLERYSHAIAGFVILACGVAVLMGL